MDLKIISVHYKTPELIYRQYESVRKFYPEIKYEIIDGSDNHQNYFKDLEDKDENFKVIRFGYNIHHGPGMDYGIKNSDKSLILILDSDVWIKEDFLHEFILDFNGIAKGLRILIDQNGFTTTNKNGYPYVHPYCMLINKTEYLKYKPFIKHGAPCIDFMVDVFEQGKSDLLIGYPIENVLGMDHKGTASKWGYNLN